MLYAVCFRLMTDHKMIAEIREMDILDSIDEKLKKKSTYDRLYCPVFRRMTDRNTTYDRPPSTLDRLNIDL